MRKNNATALQNAPGSRLEAAPAFVSSLCVSMARSPDEVKEAQRLRHRVFVEEMGARTAGAGRLERDRFDPFCKHLIVRDRMTRAVVGTYRILTPERAHALGALMCEREFDLARLAPLRERLVEVGRACIDAEYRCGSIIMLLWSGLAAYSQSRGLSHLFGCVSVGWDERNLDARAIYARLAERHLAPPEYRVFPRIEAPHRDGCASASLPPLLKGYLRAGAWICGEPAWDAEVGSSDLPVLLSLEGVESRYARHFLRSRVA